MPVKYTDEFKRDVQKGLVFGIQYEFGLTSTATGTFGPTTRALLKARPAITVGTEDSTQNFVHLFQCALTFNGYAVLLDGDFGMSSSSATSSFQSFAEFGLPR